ncbi:MAG: respiratory chain complex I subunit 1 family protein [Candidatus Aminicenantales bacterium]
MSIVYAFGNVVLFLLLAPLFDGVMRKITARVQSRQGPPVIQPYYDLFKLLGKDRMNSAGTWAFRLAPLMAFASILTVAALVPLGGRLNAFGARADAMTVVYLLTLGGVSVLLGALAGRNTFGLIGASREMVTMVMVEPVLAMTLILGAVRMKGLGLASAMSGAFGAGAGVSAAVMLVVYLLALQAFVAKQPFDTSEAEIEILEGPFIEYSGPDYALFRYSMMMKQMFYAWLFVAVFVPSFRISFVPAAVLIQLAEMLVVFVLIAVVGSTNPRLRIDQAVKYYAVLILVALGAIGLSVKGL